jgi:hypothetical protein
MRLAASRIHFLHATGGHSGTTCMRLAASRIHFCMRLAATREQFVCDWPPDAHYFSTIWQIVLTFSSKTERLHGQSAIAQTLCLALFRHASKPVRLNSYFNLSPGSLEKRLVQLKVVFIEARPTPLSP